MTNKADRDWFNQIFIDIIGNVPEEVADKFKYYTESENKVKSCGPKVNYQVGSPDGKQVIDIYAIRDEMLNLSKEDAFECAALKVAEGLIYIGSYHALYSQRESVADEINRHAIEIEDEIIQRAKEFEGRVMYMRMAREAQELAQEAQEEKDD